jgi:propionate catabolism operon transcriptional regulator
MYPKIVILGSGQFSLLANQLLKKLRLPEWIDIEIIESPMEYLLTNNPIPREKFQNQFEEATIIISGQQSASTLEEKLNNIVIPVKMLSLELLIQLTKANQSNRIAIINYKTTLVDIDTIGKQFDLEIKQSSFKNLENLHDIINDLRQKGYCKIIGGSFACEVAQEYGMESLFFYSEFSLHESLKTAIKYLHIYRKEMEQSALFKTAVKVNESGIISVDKANRVTNVSSSVESLLDINKKELLNRFVGDCIKPLRFSNDDIREDAIVFDWNKSKLVVERSPVFVANEKVGEIFVIDNVNKIEKQELNIRSKINQKTLQSQYKFDDIVGTSIKIKEIKSMAYKFSKVKSSVLIQGESGTGKELFAQSIHHASNRCQAPFVAINCATLPENLLDSELFGYEEGAFTGAKKGGKKGLFELADKGTIFLDEIGELPFHLQARLLRVLQEREVMRVGGHKVIPVDVRVIVATNKDLIKLVSDHKFREDLYYRISVLQLLVPPLRERPEDIDEIALHFLQQTQNGKYTVPPSALNQLRSYSFPGNIRELGNILERFLVYCAGEKLDEQTINIQMKQAIFPAIITKASPVLDQETLNLKERERQLIEIALIKHANNKDKAAKELGISRATLWRKLKE